MIRETRNLKMMLAMSLVFSCLALMPVGSATAQDALGRGDVLDASPGVGTGGRNVEVPTPDFRRRNLLITGDVAGGRAFRDSVGYVADTDFRGQLGGDDLFRFRADAALSSPRFAGLGGVSNQFRFGQDLAQFEFRRLTPRPPRDTRSQEWLDGDLRLPPGFDDRRIDADRMIEQQILAGMSTMMRMDQLADSRHGARQVGMQYSEAGDPFVVIASHLRGLTRVDAREMMFLDQIPQYDLVRVREDARHERLTEPLGQRRQTRFSDVLRFEDRVDGRFESPPHDDRVPSAQMRGDDSPLVTVLQQIARRYAGMTDVQLSIDPNLLAELDDEFADLRETLQAMRMPREHLPDQDLPELLIDDDEAEEERAWPDRDDDDRTTVPPAPWDRDVDEVDPLRPGERDRPADDLRQRPGDLEHDPAEDAWDSQRLEETINLLQHGQTIDQLAFDDGSRVNELILSGGSSLRRGEYFMAESRFTRALRLSPGQPMAMIGMAHAQLGAGLSHAAGLTLRETLANHPELIDVRFDTAMLPTGDHVQDIVEEINEQLDAGGLGSSVGLALAYLGKQMGDRALVERGLAAMRDAHPNDVLLPLLEGLWLTEMEDEDDASPPDEPGK